MGVMQLDLLVLSGTFIVSQFYPNLKLRHEKEMRTLYKLQLSINQMNGSSSVALELGDKILYRSLIPSF